MRPTLLIKIIDNATYAFEIRYDFKEWTGNEDYKPWHAEYDQDKKVTYVGSEYTPTWYVQLICIYHMLLYTDGYDCVFDQLDGKPLGSDERIKEVEIIMRLFAGDKYEDFIEKLKSGEQTQ